MFHYIFNSLTKIFFEFFEKKLRGSKNLDYKRH